MAVNYINANTVDMWVADTDARVISRQRTQDDSFAVNVLAGCSYILFPFDEDNGAEEWTAKTFGDALCDYFIRRNNEILGTSGGSDYLINRYQLIGLANTSRVVHFSDGTEIDPDFYATLGGSFRLSFDLKPGVTLPSLPPNILDLFECNHISAKVSRHFQQPYKNYTSVLVDGGYSTKYMALAVVNAVDKDTKENIVIDSAESTKDYSLDSYFLASPDTDQNENTDSLFTSVQNLGHLIRDVRAMGELKQYYNVTLLGSNQMRMTTSN